MKTVFIITCIVAAATAAENAHQRTSQRGTERECENRLGRCNFFGNCCEGLTCYKKNNGPGGLGLCVRMGEENGLTCITNGRCGGDSGECCGQFGLECAEGSCREKEEDNGSDYQRGY
ncbi:hypothetical protein HIM_06300 [Hirsutella minnesotensis 3608]|uniref:Uncharacterized protein n=1 Tax=Hirsutella minnesotensis 3608 TaxID=1043627 RepID=A0A0F8A4W6_9HYPO|nr:hypothetical protein HIM_06300 [Hirsutella minnesotensis 3608]